MLHFPDTRLAQYSFFNAFDCTGSACSIESPRCRHFYCWWWTQELIYVSIYSGPSSDCGLLYPVTNSKGTNVTYSCIADIPTAGPRSNVRQQCQNWHGGQGRSRNIVERRQELDEVA
ncbi:unnamed protein product [Peronospora belbahrii]|uniref:Uncharacterized protein n=1 Tax=Peronospora belbahrii TaxID=622444 RepID=A0AAU9KR21_9STRA|nr:unnamed protein product [Peronospora belbahrii]